MKARINLGRSPRLVRTPWTDEELVARSVEGDADSFNQLILRWERPIYALAYRTIGREDEARDIVQDTFLRAYRALPGFKGQAKFSSWLYRIALNLCRDWIRKQRRTPTVQTPEGMDLIELASEQGPVESIEELVSRRQMSEAVAIAMKRLPEEQRTAIVLKEYHGLTFQEIAELQGCPLSTGEDALVPGTLSAPPAVEREWDDAPITDKRESIMSEVFRCDDKETFVAYLYGEVDADVRREVERHLRGCLACQQEAEGLQSVRVDLQTWLAPDADLGFTITRTPQPAPVLTSSRWALARELPAWARLAAAALFIGVGLGLANVQVRSSNEGFVITTGWRHPASVVATTTEAPTASQPMAQVANVAANAAEQDWRRELSALEQTLREEIAAGRVTRVAARSSDANVDAAAILRSVERMIEASEERQRTARGLAVHPGAAIVGHAEVHRSAEINRSFNSLQNRT